MVLNIIILVCIGFAAAGTVHSLGRLLGRKPSRAVMPLAAGAAMIAFTLWNQATWADRMAASLPAQIRVIATLSGQSGFAPWSAVVPGADRVVAVDVSGILRHPDHPGLVIVPTLLIEQYEDTLTLRQMVDCPARRRAVLGETETFAPGAGPEDAAWEAGGEPAALYEAVCAGGA